MMNIFREPLVQFLVLGGLIFAAFAAMNDTPAAAPRDRIEVTEADTARLMRQFEATVGRPPSETELSSLIDGYVREEVLVREARALSLDRDDPIVRQQLVQKMQFLLESRVVAAPSDTDLRLYFDNSAAKFVAAPLVSFEQVLLEADPANAGAILAAVRSGTDPEKFGRAGSLPRDIPPVSRQVVDGTFGDGFFDQLAGLTIGQWTGPINSSYGLHLVRVTLLEPGRQPSFEEIRAQVEQDWRRSKAQQHFEELLSRYEVERPDTANARPR